MPSPAKELVMQPASVDELAAELGKNLASGGCFVTGASGLEPNDMCELVIVHPCGGARLSLHARVVWVSASGPRPGIGVAFEGFSPAMREQIRAFVDEPPIADAAPDDRAGEAPSAEAPLHDASSDVAPVAATVAANAAVVEAAVVEAASDEARVAEAAEDAAIDGAAGEAAMDQGALDSGPGDDGAETEPSDGDEDPAGEGRTEDQPQRLHARLRALPVHEQLKVAREGDAGERIVLERIYGKTVWAALLANPRLSIPEVIRIARMGNLPLPQLESIACNAGWITNPQIRRALLGNPRLSLDMARRVLQAMPRNELRVVPSQTAYSAAIRAEAKRVLARS